MSRFLRTDAGWINERAITQMVEGKGDCRHRFKVYFRNGNSDECETWAWGDPGDFSGTFIPAVSGYFVVGVWDHVGDLEPPFNPPYYTIPIIAWRVVGWSDPEPICPENIPDVHGIMYPDGRVCIQGDNTFDTVDEFVAWVRNESRLAALEASGKPSPSSS